MAQLRFLNRKREKDRLLAFMRKKEASLAVVYGRRRCGKSRLLQEVISKNDMYFLCDQSEAALQIKQFSDEVSVFIPGFNEAEYPSWNALLSALFRQLPKNRTIVIDEFPYMVHSTPALPSILQKFIDQGLTHNLIICGSSQKMMQGMLLDSKAPLYGRATEILKIQTLPAGWCKKALELNSISSIEAYSIWGGVPRYWELAHTFKNSSDAVKNLAFDRNGVLHNEPRGLLLDDMRSAVQPHSLLSLIANGCHRLSEIAGRVGKPAANLSRPLENLIELGYVKRELPWGESTRSTKRSLYKINDPYIQFWYRFIQPNRSLLERDLVEEVYRECTKHFPHHYGEVWESLARESTARLKLYNTAWKLGSRWWGTGLDKKKMKIDIVAESFDGKQLLLGEAKWEKNINFKAVHSKLERCRENIPFGKGKKIHLAIWAPQRKSEMKSTYIIDAEQLLASLV
ncbi:MAG: ATP-binding protein [Fibrobacteria bacterium]|nr:ATP-binding protein [Fibrobacteria bacterium]